jgi:hypothetical protein
MPCQGTCVAVSPAVRVITGMPRSWETSDVTKGHAMNIREMTEAECRAILAGGRRALAALAAAHGAAWRLGRAHEVG